MAVKAKDEEAERLSKAEADAVDLGFMEELANLMTPILKKASKASSRQAFVQVYSGPDVDKLLKQVDQAASEWAEGHAAEMVGMRWTEDGRLVENPETEYSITDSTREMIRSKVNQAIKEGWSKDTLANQLEVGPFSTSRADMIAQTELKMAHSVSNMAGWRASGQVAGKRSMLSADHDVSDECDDNADAGVIGLDEEFPSGDDSAPFHPNCHCSVIAVLEGEEGELEEEVVE